MIFELVEQDGDKVKKQTPAPVLKIEGVVRVGAGWFVAIIFIPFVIVKQVFLAILDTLDDIIGLG